MIMAHESNQEHDDIAQTDADMLDVNADCFDPDTCCDQYEQMMIHAMRAVLRPQEAPECLYEKLRSTLDRCCGQSEHVVVIHHSVHYSELKSHPLPPQIED